MRSVKEASKSLRDDAREILLSIGWSGKAPRRDNNLAEEGERNNPEKSEAKDIPGQGNILCDSLV